MLRKKQQPPVGSTPIGPSAIQQQQQQQIQQLQQEHAAQLSASTVAAAVADAQAQMSSSDSSNLMAVASSNTSTAQPTVQTLQHELLKEVSCCVVCHCDKQSSRPCGENFVSPIVKIFSEI